LKYIKREEYIFLVLIIQNITMHGPQNVKSIKEESKSDVWLAVHRNSVWIRNQLDVTFVLSFISTLQVAQHVSDNHVPIFSS